MKSKGNRVHMNWNKSPDLIPEHNKEAIKKWFKDHEGKLDVHDMRITDEDITYLALITGGHMKIEILNDHDNITE